MKNKWCPICGHSLTSRQTYCSHKCRQEGYRRKQRTVMQNPANPRYVSSLTGEGKTAGERVVSAPTVPAEVSPSVTNRHPAVTRDTAIHNLWSDLRAALFAHAAAGGTSQGALQVAQKVFMVHGFDCAAGPLPRLSKARIEELGIGKSSPNWYRGKIRTNEELARLKAADAVRLAEWVTKHKG